jgi:hypothetical protein
MLASTIEAFRILEYAMAEQVGNFDILLRHVMADFKFESKTYEGLSLDEALGRALYKY